MTSSFVSFLCGIIVCQFPLCHRLLVFFQGIIGCQFSFKATSVVSFLCGIIVCQFPFVASSVVSFGGGGVDPIPCVSTHRISDPRSGPAQLLPHTSSSAATPTGSVHKSQTVSVVGMSGQLKRCNESWFGSLQSGQFAVGWLAGSILCR